MAGPIGKSMEATVENSPWHREASVKCHTDMVLDQYNTRFAPHRSDKQNLIARLALLAHDWGKPIAEEVLEKKDGSGDVYRRYAGHEQVSAVDFQEFYVNSPELRSMITHEEARAIRWIIEHHLPYGFKDKQKRQGLAQGTFAALEQAGIGYETFFDCLRSDAAGRISDDHETKLANVEAWIEEFQKISTDRNFSRSSDTMVLLIGPSGSGKTTYIKKNFTEGDSVISLDTFRINFFKLNDSMPTGIIPVDRIAEYASAFKYASDNDSAFRQYAQHQTNDVFNNRFRGFSTVYIDNTNLSKKSRAQYVTLARQKGMQIKAVEFWNSIDTIIYRQGVRGNKSVPHNAVRQHVNSQTCAWLGLEADSVELIVGEPYESRSN